MPTLTDKPAKNGHSGNGNSDAILEQLSAERLEDERRLNELQALELELEERTDSAEMRQTVTFALSIFAAITAVIAVVVFVVALVRDEKTTSGASEQAAAPSAQAAPAAAASEKPATGGKEPKFEPYQRPDPTLPAVPAGDVKKFKVDVFEHVTKVAKDKPPTRVWSYGVNGDLPRGTGVSTPLVVNQGDKVELTLVNGGSKDMDVTIPHSIDFHSSEVAPNEAFKTIKVGESHRFSFVAKHPGVYMYHCATDPVLTHTGTGMVGMMVVKPQGLAPAKELWMTQQEFYLGKPGENGDVTKMQSKSPDVIAFNGYAAQYKEKPITVKRGERIRMYVLNAGPSIWSAFHVIGTVFDRTVIEGQVGRHAQTVNLAPSQGGWVEFTLDEEGRYPFVDHAFGDMVKGAVGVLATENAPKPEAAPAHPGHGSH